MKIAFLYAGQGSQKTGMGKDIAEIYPAFRSVLQSCDREYPVSRLMFEGTEEQLQQTHNTQPCMAAFAAGVTSVLFRAGIRPVLAAGLSLGEYSALYASGVFSVQDLMRLVVFRGKEMEAAAQGISCSMCAVLGLSREKLQEAVRQAGQTGKVFISNYNCTGQSVLAGEADAVKEAETLALAAGARRCIPLKVSGPFHTPFMKPAGLALRRELEKPEWKEKIDKASLHFPVLMNVTARPCENTAKLPELLEKQVQSSVYMEDILLALPSYGIDTIIEIGPGKVLSGFARHTVPGIRTYSIETAADLELVLRECR